MNVKSISLGEKEYLNPGEAAVHWNLSRRKFFKFLEDDHLPFVALYGTRKLIIRAAFDKYLHDNPRKKVELANGEANNTKKRLEA